MKNYSTKDKKVLISGYYGFDNFGDEAILGVLTGKLAELNTDVTVLSKNPSKTQSLYGVKTIFSFDYKKVFSEIKKCDVLISGGGSLLQDVTSIKSLLYYLFIINSALFLNKRVIIFAQGIGPITSKFGCLLTKLALKKCSLVTVRDEKSLFLVRSWGVNARLVCDPLFDISLPGFDYKQNISPRSLPSNKLGVQLRGFKTLKENLLVKLAKQINKDFSDKEIEIYSFQDSLDLDVCKRFEAILKSINPVIQTKLIYNQNSQEILDKISKIDYMVAMRFHANLIALKYGIKTLAICYDQKVEKLAIEAKIPYVSMLANEDYDTLFDKLKNLDEQNLIDFSKSKHFDWSAIESVLNT